MKNKKFNRKLTLNKSTVADLQKIEMTAIKGGISEDTCPHKCPTTDPGTDDTLNPPCITATSCTFHC